MLKKEKIIDPIPSVHRFFQKVDGLVDPDGPENQGKKKKGFVKYFIALMVVIVAMQLIFDLVFASEKLIGS